MLERQKVLILTTKLSELAENISEYKQFTELLDVHVYETNSKEVLIEKLHNEYNDISALWVTGISLFQYGGLLAVVEHFPKSLKVYVYPWVGYTAEEAKALKDRNIIFCNAGDLSAHDVADQALFLTLATFRFTSYYEYSFRKNLAFLPSRTILGSKSWDQDGNPTPPPERANLAYSSSIGGKKLESPRGKTAGIIGLGSIGKAIGIRLTAIGMKVLYTKRSELTEAEYASLGYKAEYVPTIAELLTKVDLIVNAAPHSPETTNIINEESLKTVRKGVRIVNIGRGTAIDEDALIKTLDDGTVCAVGLDVFRSEPSNIDPRFAKRWDVTMTPHIGNVTTDNVINGNIRCMENIKNVLLEGGKGLTPIQD